MNINLPVWHCPLITWSRFIPLLSGTMQVKQWKIAPQIESLRCINKKQQQQQTNINTTKHKGLQKTWVQWVLDSTLRFQVIA